MGISDAIFNNFYEIKLALSVKISPNKRVKNAPKGGLRRQQ